MGNFVTFSSFWVKVCLDTTLKIRIIINCVVRQCTAIPYRVSTGPEQGFPCVVNSHREKPVFITGNPCSHCRDPVFITGKSLWELLHREIPVVTTGNGFAVQSSSNKVLQLAFFMNLVQNHDSSNFLYDPKCFIELHG